MQDHLPSFLEAVARAVTAAWAVYLSPADPSTMQAPSTRPTSSGARSAQRVATWPALWATPLPAMMGWRSPGACRGWPVRRPRPLRSRMLAWAPGRTPALTRAPGRGGAAGAAMPADVGDSACVWSRHSSAVAPFFEMATGTRSAPLRAPSAGLLLSWGWG